MACCDVPFRPSCSSPWILLRRSHCYPVQEGQPAGEGTPPGLEPFYTAASALPEYVRQGSTAPDSISMADMDAAFADEPEPAPTDTYLRGSQGGAGGTLGGIVEGDEPAIRVQGPGDHGHISSPFQEGARTPATPRAHSSGSGMLSRCCWPCEPGSA